MKVLVSASLEPFYNLAVEEVLLEGVGRWGSVLFFWRSARAVVIGKHQNPWRECRLRDVLQEEGRLGRRISGGGAVYQDEGNLNVSLVTPRDRYEREAPYAMLVDALGALGARAERLGKTSLGVGGHKVSGHAFCFRRGAVLHHGTLLMQADLGRMTRWLTPMQEGYETHATRSEPSEVMNLADALSGLTEAKLRAAVVAACEARFKEPMDRIECGDLPCETVEAAAARHASWDWLFGQTPAFTYRAGAGPWVKVVKGRVVEWVARGGAGGLDLRAGQAFDPDPAAAAPA